MINHEFLLCSYKIIGFIEKELNFTKELELNFFYILSTPENVKIDKYKIGICNKKIDINKTLKINWVNARNNLKTRYRTPLEFPKIFYFKLVPNNRFIEKEMLLKFDKQRTIFDTDNKSEWIKEEFLILKEYAKEIIKKYGYCNNNKNEHHEIYKKLKICEYVKEHSFIFPNNKLIITNIIWKKHTYIIEVDDNYCPFIQENHNGEKTIYMEVNKIGMCLKCKKCPYEIFPNQGHVPLQNNILKSIFGLQIGYVNNIIKNDKNKIKSNNEFRKLYKDFKHEVIIKTNNINDYVEFNEIRTIFKEWYNFNTRGKYLNFKTIKECLDKIFKCQAENHKIKKNDIIININGWIGYKIIIDNKE